LYQCSVNPIDIGSITWNFSTASFYGYLKLMINIDTEDCVPCYTWVQCLVSGSLSASNASASVSSVNPIFPTSNQSVYTVDYSVSPPNLVSYSDLTTAQLIQSSLKGTINVQFPRTTSCNGTYTSSPLWTWIYNNQYITVTYDPFRPPCGTSDSCAISDSLTALSCQAVLQ
jgi:hypothetical protein